MDQGGRDPVFDGWDELDWKQRRERRFQRWLSAPGVDFVDADARRAYRERVRLLIDAIMLRKPDRVPVGAWVGFFAGKYSGFSPGEVMRDPDKAAAALTKYHEDFSPDFQARPVAPAGVFERLDLHMVRWPGRGLDDQTPWQYVETEYMRADEYDVLIADPETYFRRSLLPRFGSTFASLAGLPPFTDMVEAASMPFALLPFGDPALAAGLERFAGAAKEAVAFVRAAGAADADAAGRLGIPPEMTGTAKAPYDILADTLRGTRGIMTDRFRRPDKILEAAERLVPLQVDLGVRQAARAAPPLIVFWLHKGADGFMSDGDFRSFYWPTLKAVVKGLVEQGIVPALFAEGGYTSRLETIADDDLPAGSVLWFFDDTDMPAARRALDGHACVAGNVPTTLLTLGTAGEVREYVKRLLDTCARHGGFFLRNGAVLDDARPENLLTMFETGREWTG